MPTLSPDPHAPGLRHPLPRNADPMALFEALLPRIDRVLAGTARRRSLSDEEAEELRSFAYRRLLANDCAILRKYRGQSRWTTFLTVVVQRLFLDFRNHRWGKWRPCARARHRGETGILLDQLVSRDGFGTEEAIRILRQNHQVRIPAETLRRWAAELPRHGRPVNVGEECLAACPSGEGSDAQVLAAERARGIRRVYARLQKALAALPAEDRLIVKMRYLDGLRVSDIARALSLPQKPLYRRLETSLKQLRSHLEAAGCPSEDVARLLAED